MSQIHILKFGGTSLQNIPFIKQAAEVVKERAGSARPVVVVSAIAGVTDRLYKLSRLPENSNGEAASHISDLENDHSEILQRLGGRDPEGLSVLFRELEATYYNNDLKSEKYGAWRDRLLSIGERASARIFASALRAQGLGAIPIDAHNVIRTDNRFGEANIQPEATRILLANKLADPETIPVVTGFIGATDYEEITTLGRSGSDYTASLVADALGAEQLEIWTDVNGVLTADPKLVPEAQNIRYLSFEDIAELSAHGAKVIHPKTIQPVRESDITVYVKNSLRPEDPGTTIRRDHSTNGAFRSVTVNGPFVYVELPDAHAEDFHHRLQDYAAERLSSEEYGFSRTSHFEPAQFVVPESTYTDISNDLNLWAKQKEVNLQVQGNLYRINAFTNSLKESDKPVAEILEALHRVQIRPLRIHREHGKRYLSLLFPKHEATRAARIINRSLTSGSDTVDVFLAGVGAVGGTLLNKLLNYQSDSFNIRVVGWCNSSKVIFPEDNRGNAGWKKLLEAGEATHWPDIIDRLTRQRDNPVIFVDATGSEEVARRYPDLLRPGIHIATPSKLANTFEQDFYNRIRKIAARSRASLRYETTVGAGLPIISTIQDLQNSGDAITELSGVVSGTMTYLFTELEKGTPFSEAVKDARAQGYAEPDPRDDLSGEDVARKFLTLAREIGIDMERDDLVVESLIPEDLREANLDEFLNRLEEHDETWKKKTHQAAGRDQVLRYTGKLVGNKITIGIDSVTKSSPLGQLQGTDNLLLIRTRAYNDQPLIIQGPGAGREVTANGVFADILKIAHQLI